jgi:hypothetical protein
MRCGRGAWNARNPCKKARGRRMYVVGCLLSSEIDRLRLDRLWWVQPVQFKPTIVDTNTVSTPPIPGTHLLAGESTPRRRQD